MSKKSKVTATKCLKGRRHRWQNIHIDATNYGQIDYTSWCKTCGCVTEFFKADDMKRRERCMDYTDEGEEIYVEIPEHLKE